MKDRVSVITVKAVRADGIRFTFISTWTLAIKRSSLSHYNQIYYCICAI